VVVAADLFAGADRRGLGLVVVEVGVVVVVVLVAFFFFFVFVVVGKVVVCAVVLVCFIEVVWLFVVVLVVLGRAGWRFVGGGAVAVVSTAGVGLAGLLTCVLKPDGYYTLLQVQLLT